MKIVNIEYTGYCNAPWIIGTTKGVEKRDPIMTAHEALGRRDIWYRHPYQYSDFIMFVLQQQLDMLVQTHLETIMKIQPSREIIVENVRCGVSVDFPLPYTDGMCLSIPVDDETKFKDYFGGLEKITQVLDVSWEDWQAAPSFARPSRGFKNERNVFLAFRKNDYLRTFLVQEDGFRLMHRLINVMNFVGELIRDGDSPSHTDDFIYSDKNPVQTRYDEFVKRTQKREVFEYNPEFDKSLVYFFSHTFGEPLFMNYDMRTNVGTAIDYEFFPYVWKFFEGTILEDRDIIIGI